jgi:hypothetical protein
MWFWVVFLVLRPTTGSTASGAASTVVVARLERDGRFLFVACEFNRAALLFERALAAQPKNAGLYHRLSKSYARQPGVSGPLFAPNNSLRAPRYLEERVNHDPITATTGMSRSPSTRTRQSGSTEDCSGPRHFWNESFSSRNPIQNHGSETADSSTCTSLRARRWTCCARSSWNWTWSRRTSAATWCARLPAASCV